MTALFADTFYWIALADYAEGVQRSFRRAGNPFSPACNSIGRAPDKGYSLVDCISV